MSHKPFAALQHYLKVHGFDVERDGDVWHARMLGGEPITFPAHGQNEDYRNAHRQAAEQCGETVNFGSGRKRNRQEHRQNVAQRRADTERRVAQIERGSSDQLRREQVRRAVIARTHELADIERLMRA